jgi:hypothetical protein
MLRADIPSELGIFRDECHRHKTFIHRALAARLATLAAREISFSDPQLHRTVYFDTKPPRRGSLKARLSATSASATPYDSSLPLSQRIGLKIQPLLESQQLAEVEQVLLEWLADEPASPYHIIRELQITTPLQDVASYFDEFCITAKAIHPLRAVYTEMNAFTINPDLWFCTAFAFSKHGGRHGYDWLGDFTSSSENCLVISGLEPLQELYERSEKPGTSGVLIELLIVVKFQRLLQEALPLMQHLKCPLLAAAHEAEFIVELAHKRRPRKR